MILNVLQLFILCATATKEDEYELFLDESIGITRNIFTKKIYEDIMEDFEFIECNCIRSYFRAEIIKQINSFKLRTKNCIDEIISFKTHTESKNMLEVKNNLNQFTQNIKLDVMILQTNNQYIIMNICLKMFLKYNIIDFKTYNTLLKNLNCTNHLLLQDVNEFCESTKNQIQMITDSYTKKLTNIETFSSDVYQIIINLTDSMII